MKKAVEGMTVFAFLVKHERKLRTSNSIEPLNRCGGHFSKLSCLLALD